LIWYFGHNNGGPRTDSYVREISLLASASIFHFFFLKKLRRHQILCYHLFLGVIIFGSVRFLSKKITKPNFFFWKKNRNRVKPTGFGSVFLGQKPAQTGLARFFQFWLGFLGFGSVFFLFGSVFSVWLGFSGLNRFWLGLARFFSGFLSVSVRFGSVFLVFCL